MKVQTSFHFSFTAAEHLSTLLVQWERERQRERERGVREAEVVLPDACEYNTLISTGTEREGEREAEVMLPDACEYNTLISTGTEREGERERGEKEREKERARERDREKDWKRKASTNSANFKIRTSAETLRVRHATLDHSLENMTLWENGDVDQPPPPHPLETIQHTPANLDGAHWVKQQMRSLTILSKCIKLWAVKKHEWKLKIHPLLSEAHWCPVRTVSHWRRWSSENFSNAASLSLLSSVKKLVSRVEIHSCWGVDNELRAWTIPGLFIAL